MLPSSHASQFEAGYTLLLKSVTFKKMLEVVAVEICKRCFVLQPMFFSFWICASSFCQSLFHKSKLEGCVVHVAQFTSFYNFLPKYFKSDLFSILLKHPCLADGYIFKMAELFGRLGERDGYRAV